jgi:DUF1680 family protein
MFNPVSLGKTRINDPFFAGRIDNARNVAIPYMWNALNDAIPGVAPSGCISNFEIAAGLKEGKFYGFVFQDSDLWKWIEGVAYSLATHPDAGLEKRADDAIELAGKAQQADGYLDTYYIINGLDKRFTNIRDHHEFYVAGHMFEAAAAYYEATGKRRLLDIACRFADCIAENFGSEEHKKHGYPGHEEIELGLARLYGCTGEGKYLALAKYFLDMRGTQPYYFDEEALARGEKLPEVRKGQWQTYSYFQAHVPVREQKEAAGHAVRQGYLLAGMADVGALAGDPTLVEAADRVFDNIINRQMYITAGVGSVHVGEAFSYDYDLPAERCYTETCASIALIMTAIRLNRISPNGRYGDIVERALYNGILSGISLDGTKYFYQNPLEVWPERCERRQDMDVAAERQGWFGCACCPPNVLRTLTGLGNYLYTVSDETLYVDQYVSAEADAGVIAFKLESGFPWNGGVKFTVTRGAKCRVAFRIPGWARDFSIDLRGESLRTEVVNGYVVVDADFKAGDVITLDFPMEVRWMNASMNTPNYVGKVALMRGPLVYCAEQADNGDRLWSLAVKPGRADVKKSDILGGVVTISCEGERSAVTGELYSETIPEKEPAVVTFVPYYAWGNRGKGEMSVWMYRA